jgi:hypothetical protein
LFVAKADKPVAGFAKEITHVCHKLEKISKGHHDSTHHVQHPHFKELRLQWEAALEGLISILQGFGDKDVVTQVKMDKVEAQVQLTEVEVLSEDIVVDEPKKEVQISKLVATETEAKNLEKAAETDESSESHGDEKTKHEKENENP